jgi:AGZA family xanthine/uracil permease-like MFS transporter
MINDFFKLKENGTTIGREIVAGVTTFFAMSYILFVNPSILSQTGMPFQAVFLATIISSAIGTLIMGMFANVPYAQAPGMGLNSFFTYTVCFGLGYTWQQALAMVFLCGIINMIITITRFRKMLIKAIPESLQHAIGGGIGIFVAFIGIKSAGLLTFTANKGNYKLEESGAIFADSSIIPSLAPFNNPTILVALFGIVLTAILVLKNVKGSFLIGIIVTTIVAIPAGVIDLSSIDWRSNSLISSFGQLKTTFGAALGSEGLLSLFKDIYKLPIVLMTILAFSLTDIFDNIGTLIGTGRRTGIFSKEDEIALDQHQGLKTKLDKALFADMIATTVGAVIGTSNVTTFVESSTGIASGGRTGLTSIVTTILFLASSLLAPLIGIVPAQATAPALIFVGIFMMASFIDVKWTDLEEAIPAFFAGIFMGFAYSISNGISVGFIVFTIVKIVKGKTKEVHPILWIIDALFLLNYVMMALVQ